MACTLQGRAPFSAQLCRAPYIAADVLLQLQVGEDAMQCTWKSAMHCKVPCSAQGVMPFGAQGARCQVPCRAESAMLCKVHSVNAQCPVLWCLCTAHSAGRHAVARQCIVPWYRCIVPCSAKLHRGLSHGAMVSQCHSATVPMLRSGPAPSRQRAPKRAPNNSSACALASLTGWSCVRLNISSMSARALARARYRSVRMALQAQARGHGFHGVH